MSYKDRQPAALPPHLTTETISSLAPDSPRYIEPDYIYIDGPQVYLRRDESLPAKSRINRGSGRIAIMLAVIETGEVGYVADMRSIKHGDDFFPAASDEAPSDQEAFNDWQNDLAQQVAIAAIISRSPDSGKNELSGDEDFFNALTYLVGEVDKSTATLKEKKREEKVLAKKASTEKPADPASTSEQNRNVSLGSKISDKIGANIIRVKLALGLPLY